EMQARAIFEGAAAAKRKTGAEVQPEIMTPLIIARTEFDLIKARIDAVAQGVASETGEAIAYSVGTMIETPRACLRAGEIAEKARLTYVSCSPFRVPVARLAAAQAALKRKAEN